MSLCQRGIYPLKLDANRRPSAVCTGGNWIARFNLAASNLKRLPAASGMVRVDERDLP